LLLWLRGFRVITQNCSDRKLETEAEKTGPLGPSAKFFAIRKDNSIAEKELLQLSLCRKNALPVDQRLGIGSGEKLIKKWLWKCLRPEWQLQSGIRVTLGRPGDWQKYNRFFVDAEYDLPIRAMLNEQSLSNRSEIYDIGARSGWFCLRVAHLFLQHGGPGKEKVFRVLAGSKEELKTLAVVLGQPLGGEVHLYCCSLAAESEATGNRKDTGAMSEALRTAEQIDLMRCSAGEPGDFEVWKERGIMRKTRHMVVEMRGRESVRAGLVQEMKGHGFDREVVLREGGDVVVSYFGRSKG
jgi:hypothetical protein